MKSLLVMVIWRGGECPRAYANLYAQKSLFIPRKICYTRRVDAPRKIKPKNALSLRLSLASD